MHHLIINHLKILIFIIEFTIYNRNLLFINPEINPDKSGDIDVDDDIGGEVEVLIATEIVVEVVVVVAFGCAVVGIPCEPVIKFESVERVVTSCTFNTAKAIPVIKEKIIFYKYIQHIITCFYL